jgi:hypothetical protein
MPIRHLLEANPGVFVPEQIEAIAEAFEDVLKDFKLRDRNEPVVTMVAKLTIELAKQGEFTAAQLRARVATEMKQLPN